MPDGTERLYEAVLEHTCNPPYQEGTMVRRLVGRATQMPDGTIFVELTDQEFKITDLCDHGGVYELFLKPTTTGTWVKVMTDLMKKLYGR